MIQFVWTKQKNAFRVEEVEGESEFMAFEDPASWTLTLFRNSLQVKSKIKKERTKWNYSGKRTDKKKDVFCTPTI